MMNRFRHSHQTERTHSLDTRDDGINNKSKEELRDVEKDTRGPIDDAPVQFMTFRVFMMGIVVSIGGMIFGYDTGTPHRCT
jgi:hypothetical protein